MLSRISGLETYYTLDGQGDPVVLLHGWGTSSQSLAGVAASLRETFRVLSLDLPGFGWSQAPPEAWGTEEYATHVFRLLDQADISRAAFVGHSFGGRIAISLSVRRPERVSHLALVASAGVRPPRGARYRFRVTVTKLLARFAGLPGCGRLGEQLLDLDKVVLLDADTIVLRNIDVLFERPSFAAAPDFFLPDRFNSGVMVLEPSAAVFRAMIDRFHSSSSYDGGDQGFLNRFYPDWYAMPVANRLPAGYNLHHFVFQFLCAHDYLKKGMLDEVRVIHYTLQKPWMTATVSGASSLWWNQFFGAHPEQDAAWKRRIHQIEDWSFDSVVAALGGE